MKQKILITSLVLFIAILTQAQTVHVKKRAVGLSVGWQNFKVLDKHASPLSYGTNSIFPKLGFSYSRQTNRSDFEIELSGASGQMNPKRFGARSYKTKFSQTDSFQYAISSPFYNANLKASYFRNISSLSNGNLKYWAGGVLNESAYYADGVANQPWIINSVDLSPAFKVEYASPRHSIGIKVDFALIALVSRATYALFPKSNKDNNVAAFFKQGTRTTFPDKYRKGSLQLNYRYQVSDKFAVGLSKSTKWIRYSDPRMLHAIDNNLDVKFLYTY